MLEPWAAADDADIVDRARLWLTSDALDQLVRRLGGPGPSLDRLAQLRSWSSATLDTRRGAERRDAALLDLPPAGLTALIEAADPLGLARTAPPVRRRYDIVVILAGATTGNRLRAQLARETVRSVDTSLIVALASHRPISQSERAEEPASAEDTTESHNLVRHVTRVFGLRPDGDHISVAAHDEESLTNDGTRLRVVTAPDIGGRRPTTSQQLEFLSHRIAVAQRRSVLLVSSAIYAPYQFFGAAREVLVDGADHVELIGTVTDLTGEVERLAQRLGQEVHAALDAATRLVDRVGPNFA